MSAPSLDVFDTTLQKTYGWLKDVMQVLGWEEDRHRAYGALRAALHALRDRLSVEEVVQLGAQLPMLIRGFYYEGWDPTGKPLRVRHKEQFLARIQQELELDTLIDAERVVRAVFAVLAQHISQGEIANVKHVLPAGFQDLWP